MSLRNVTLVCSISVLLAACGSSDNTVNTAPTVSAVGISSLGLLSATTIGTTLTAEYTYNDADNDPEGATTFQWYRDGVEIDGATGKTYDIVAEDKDKKITVKVTPVASSGSNTDPVTVDSATSGSSDGTASIPSNFAPKATDVKITGTAEVGYTLTGDYTFSDPESDQEGGSTFRWLRGDTEIATTKTYKLVEADANKDITFAVTPVTSAGASGTEAKSAATSIAPANTAPTATEVKITGTTSEGEVLTGEYKYNDADGDAQGTSTFRWLRNNSAIAGATNKTYKVAPEDIGKNLIFAVTPVAKTGVAGSIEAKSVATTIPVPNNDAPQATNVKITGTTNVGDTLTGSYTYSDKEGNTEANTTFRWLRDGTAISGKTSKSLKITQADVGKAIVFEVTPVASAGTEVGTATTSAATNIPTPNTPPKATQVKISGMANEGETLTGTYTYSDVDQDTESGTTLSWLRNGQPIPNETGSTYTLVNADVGTEIKFAVLPKAGSGTTEGALVSSDSVTIKGTVLSMKCGATTEASYTPTFVDNAVADRAWSLVDNNKASVPVTIDDIISEFNAGRAADPTVKEKLKMPTKSVWDAYSPSRKILYLVNSERCARGIMPFEGIDPRMVTTAQFWADHLSDTGLFTHGTEGTSDYYTNRITNSGVNSDPNSATQNADFLAQGENLAYFQKSYPTAPTINEPEAAAVYNWMYFDKDATTPKNAAGVAIGPATYGHRTFITIRKLSTTNNYGHADTEGLFGGAIKTKTFTVQNTQGTIFPTTRVDVVMHAFDPNTNYVPETGKTITPAPTLIHPSSQSDCLTGFTYNADDKTCK